MEKLLKWRIPLIIGLIALTVVAGLFLGRMKKDTGVTALLPTTDGNYLYYKEVEKVFGGNEEYVIAVKDPEGIYKPANISAVRELSDFLAQIPEVDSDQILSLTAVDDLTVAEGELITGKLIPEELSDRLTAEEVLVVREKVRDNELFRGKLVNDDETTTAVIASSVHDDAVMIRITETIEAKIREMQKSYPHLEFHLSGGPVNEAYTSKIMDRDLGILMPIALLIVLILLYVFLRSFAGVILPVMVVLFSIIWAFGLKALLGSPMTITETTIPVMLIAIGSADGIHIISDFFKQLKKGLSVRESIVATMKEMTLPVILTSVTTALGTLSLLTSPGISLKNLGIYLSVGVLSAMLFSLVLIPSFLSFYRGRKKKQAEKMEKSASVPRWIQVLSGKIIQFRWILASVFGILLTLSVFGVMNVTVDSDEYQYLKKSHPLRKSTDAIKKNLGGITSLEIIFEGDREDRMKEPEVLLFMEQLKGFLEKQEEVNFTISFADYIRRMNYILHDKNPELNRVPGVVEVLENGRTIPGKNAVAQLLMLFEMGGGDTLSELIDFNAKRSRMVVRLRETSHLELKKLMAKLEPFAGAHAPEGVKVRYSGHYINLNISGLIVSSQVQSLVITVAVIFLLLSLIFRSPVLGAVTTVPVFIAILFNFAVMWLFRVPLNIGTAIVASIGMGIGIDYAIHFFTRFRSIYNGLGQYEEALRLTIEETAPGVLINAASVGLGFLVLVFSNYMPITALGWIIALTMFTTAASSLAGVPSILAIFKPDPNGWVFNRKKKNVPVMSGEGVTYEEN